MYSIKNRIIHGVLVGDADEVLQEDRIALRVENGQLQPRAYAVLADLWILAEEL